MQYCCGLYLNNRQQFKTQPQQYAMCLFAGRITHDKSKRVNFKKTFNY